MKLCIQDTKASKTDSFFTSLTPGCELVNPPLRCLSRWLPVGCPCSSSLSYLLPIKCPDQLHLLKSPLSRWRLKVHRNLYFACLWLWSSWLCPSWTKSKHTVCISWDVAAEQVFLECMQNVCANTNWGTGDGTLLLKYKHAKHQTAHSHNANISRKHTQRFGKFLPLRLGFLKCF